jgi:hypothetical protein
MPSEAIKAELARLKKKAFPGDLTPDMIIKAARSPRSVLHGRFNWDDESAAHAHRLDQARELIRTVYCDVINKGRRIISVPVYYHRPNAVVQGYVDIHDLRNSKDLALEAVAREVYLAEAATLRAQHLAIAVDLGNLIEDLLTHVRRVIDAVSATSGSPSL